MNHVLPGFSLQTVLMLLPLCVAAGFGCGGSRGERDVGTDAPQYLVTRPAAAVPAHLKYFGYWKDTSYVNDYMDELEGHVNYTFISVGGEVPGGITDATQIAKAKKHGMKAVVDVGFIFVGPKMRLREGYRENWENFARDIHEHRDAVIAFFLADEPITFARGSGLEWEPIRVELDKAAAVMKKTFPDIPVMIDFAGDLFEYEDGAAGQKKRFKHAMPKNAEWIGLECYDPKADFFEIIALLKSRLGPNQKIVIIPNASNFGHHSTKDLLKLADQLYDVARSEPKVVALMPFMWQGAWDSVDPLKGARDVPELKAKYRGIGKEIVDANANAAAKKR